MKLTQRQREIVKDCLAEHRHDESWRDRGTDEAVTYLGDCTDASYNERVEAVQAVRRSLAWT